MNGFDGALPGPLARLRALRIQRARRPGRAKRGKTAKVDGFELMLPAGVDAPIVAGSRHPDSFLGRNLGVRGGERVLVAPAGSGLVALHAARSGAHVTILGGRGDVVGLERSFRLSGFGAPSAVRGLDGDDFDAIVLAEGHDPVDLSALAQSLGRGGRILMTAADRDSADLRAELDRSGLRWSTLVLERDPVFGARRVLRAWPALDAPGGYVNGGESLPGAGWVLRDR